MGGDTADFFLTSPLSRSERLTMYPAAWLLLLTLAASVCPSYQQDSCIQSTATNLMPSTCVPWEFFGTYVDLDRPLPCDGTLRAWNYCSNVSVNGIAYVTVWRRNATAPCVLDLVYIQELNSSTVPSCPGAVAASKPFFIETGDFLGVIQPVEEALPSRSLVCGGNSRTLYFVQAVNASDTAAQIAAGALRMEQLMNDSLYLNIAPVIGASSSSELSRTIIIYPSPVTSSHPVTPSHPPVTVIMMASGGTVVAIAASVVTASVAAALVTLTVVLCICLNKRKLLCLGKKGNTLGIGNNLYMLTAKDGEKVFSGPIYEDPTVTTMGRKPNCPEPDYEVDETFQSGTDWAQAYDVVTMALPASSGSEKSHLCEDSKEQHEYQYSRPHPLEGAYAVSGRVDVDPPTYSSPLVHQYHILEQIVKGEYIYEDVSPFKEPPGHVSELYAELSKFNVTRIPSGDITVTGPLGTGHFSVVNRGIWKDPSGTSRDVAIKSLASSDHLSKVKFLQEAVIMGQFKHPNVVHLCGSVTEGDSVLLVIEYLHNGDLSQHLQQMRTKSEGLRVSPRAPTLLLEFCQQVAFGMHYLATKGFIHRDLAARNILVSEDGVCKIADFGLSRDLASEDYYVSKGGAVPIKWTAPEAIHYKKYSTASDVWSYGCLLYEIWSVGHKPFEGLSNMEVIQKVSAGYRLPPPPGCPHAVYKLMVSCWHPDTTLRPQFREILAILIGHNGTVLSIPDDIVSSGTQASVLGAPLISGITLYMDLQTMYMIRMSS